jgi:hypothetical protein
VKHHECERCRGQRVAVACPGTGAAPRHIAEVGPPELPGWGFGICAHCGNLVWVNEERLECYLHTCWDHEV